MAFRGVVFSKTTYLMLVWPWRSADYLASKTPGTQLILGSCTETNISFTKATARKCSITCLLFRSISRSIQDMDSPSLPEQEPLIVSNFLFWLIEGHPVQYIDRDSPNGSTPLTLTRCIKIMHQVIRQTATQEMYMKNNQEQFQVNRFHNWPEQLENIGFC